MPVKKIAAVLALAAAAFILFPMTRPAADAPVARASQPEASPARRDRSSSVVIPMMATTAAPAPIEHGARIVDGYALEAQLRGGLEAAADDSASDPLPAVALTPHRMASAPMPPIAAPAVSERPPRVKPEGASDDEGSDGSAGSQP